MKFAIVNLPALLLLGLVAATPNDNGAQVAAGYQTDCDENKPFPCGPIQYCNKGKCVQQIAPDFPCETDKQCTSGKCVKKDKKMVCFNPYGGGKSS